MTTRRPSFSSVVIFTFLLFLAFASVKQLDKLGTDNCSGLACSTPADCGTSCFCNRTVWMCTSSTLPQ